MYGDCCKDTWYTIFFVWRNRIALSHLILWICRSHWFCAVCRKQRTAPFFPHFYFLVYFRRCYHSFYFHCYGFYLNSLDCCFLARMPPLPWNAIRCIRGSPSPFVVFLDLSTDIRNASVFLYQVFFISRCVNSASQPSVPIFRLLIPCKHS